MKDKSLKNEGQNQKDKIGPKNDALTVTENSNVNEADILLRLAFLSIHHTSFLASASGCPDGFIKFTGIHKQFPSDESVWLTAANLVLLFDKCAGDIFTKDQVVKVLEAGCNAGVFMAREWEGFEKSYKFPYDGVQSI